MSRVLAGLCCAWRRLSRHRVGPVLLGVLWLGGCTSGVVWRKGQPDPGTPLHVFPSKLELQRLAAELPAPPAPALAELEAYTLELPLLDTESPVHGLFPALSPSAQPAPALDCVAYELARLMLHTPKQQPSLGLRHFIAARCGAIASLPGFQVWRMNARRELSDAALTAELRALLVKSPPPAPHATAIGAAIVRDNQSALFVAVYAKPQVELEPFSMVVGQDATFRLRGRLLLPSDAAVAYVNAGEHGVTRCAFDEALALPQFAISCPLHPQDDHAWVQLAAIPHGSVLQRDVVSMIALRDLDAATEYRPTRLETRQPAADGAQFASAVLHTLNGLRARPLQLSAAQDQLAHQLAPALLTAAVADDTTHEQRFDQIMLGLLAGWDVTGGTIRGAQLTTGLHVGDADPASWLADALERPLGRAVLLDPEADVLAVGALLQPQPSLVAGAAITYSFFRPEPQPGVYAQQVLARLTRVRSARGLGETQLLPTPTPLARELGRIAQGELEARAALENVLRDQAATARHKVRGVLWETQDLDHSGLPPELLVPGVLKLSAGVSFARAHGGAWGQYSVLFLIVGP